MRGCSPACRARGTEDRKRRDRSEQCGCMCARACVYETQPLTVYQDRWSQTRLKLEGEFHSQRCHLNLRVLLKREDSIFGCVCGASGK